MPWGSAEWEWHKLGWPRSLPTLVVPCAQRTGCSQKAAGPHIQDHCALKENITKNVTKLGWPQSWIRNYSAMHATRGQLLGITAPSAISELGHPLVLSPLSWRISRYSTAYSKHSWVKGHRGDWLLDVFPFLYQLCSKAELLVGTQRRISL